MVVGCRWAIHQEMTEVRIAIVLQAGHGLPLRMTSSRSKRQANLHLAKVDKSTAEGSIEDLALRHLRGKRMFSLQ